MNHPSHHSYYLSYKDLTKHVVVTKCKGISISEQECREPQLKLLFEAEKKVQELETVNNSLKTLKDYISKV